jgi:hypothetical protein
MSHGISNTRPRTAVITCAVLETEIAHFARGLSHITRIEVLEQGLHNQPDVLRAKLQKAIDRVETETDADVIVLGYGLCSRGTVGVQTSRCRLVIARAHDCITHLLGDKDRYARYVAGRPGTYWYSPGWNKHAPMPGKERHEKLHRQYTKEYGEDNAQFLMDTEQHWFKTYSNAAFVHLGVGDIEKEWQYTQQCAAWLGWHCDHQCGDPALLKDLLAGPWDNQRFVVLAPGETFRMTADDRVIEKENNRVAVNQT